MAEFNRDALFEFRGCTAADLELTRVALAAQEASRAEAWERNAAANAARGENRSVAELYGLAAGGAAIVCGAGRSLNREVGRVRRLKEEDGAFVIAVDRAYRTLADAGAAPHLIVSCDSSESVAEMIRGADCPAALSWVSPPAAADAVKGAVYRHAPALPMSGFWNRMYERLGREIANTRAGFVVTFTAVDIAVWMGFDRIVTIGNELCYTSMGAFRKDANGGLTPVCLGGRVTLPGFVAASAAFGLFPEAHPEISFVDASGGLEKPGWARVALRRLGRAAERGEKRERVIAV